MKIFVIFFLVLLTAFLPLAASNAVHADVNTSPSATQNTELNTTYFSIPSGGEPLSIVKGSDGNLWFTIDNTGPREMDSSGNEIFPIKGSIGKITPDGKITEFPLPDAGYKDIDDDVDSFSFTLTAGSDGNMWFTEAEANKVGKITPQGDITTYSLPNTGMYPRSMTAGPDGNIWFMIAGSQGREMISMNTDGQIIKQISIPGSGYGHYEHTLTFGPDGNLWFRGTDFFHNDGTGFVASIGRLTTSGVYTSFTIAGAPVDIISGNSNDLWVGLNGGVLTKITTDGVTTPYQNAPGELSWILAKGPDNTMWIKDSSAKDINTISSDGLTTTTYPLSGVGQYASANDMTFGSDDTIWFTGNGEIGKIDLTSLTATPTPTQTPTPTDDPTATPTPTVTPTIEPTATPTPTELPTPSLTDTPVPTTIPTITPTPTVTSPTPTAIPTNEPTSTPTPTATPAPTNTPEPSPSCTPTPTPSDAPDSDNSQTQTVTAVVNSQTNNSSNNSSSTNDNPSEMKTFTSGTGNTSDGNLFIEPRLGSMEINVKIDLANPFTMTYSAALVPVPWQQGFNTVSDIFNFTATSVFNGYPVTTLDHPAIIMMHYDPTKLQGHSSSDLRIGWFNDQTGKWEVLKDNTVIDPTQHLIANTTTHLGYYTVLYSKN